MAYSIGSLVIFITVCFEEVSRAADGPLVTLEHGGKVRGMSYVFENTTVDHFWSVRYAEPPTGDMRFKKPVAASWKREKLAQRAERVCLQYGFTGAVEGEEDCLFLDVIVPGGVDHSESGKAVMVWVHGGGYMSGHRLEYPATPLAVRGDVIVVTINYRLGILGFLSNGTGTGNYGLWDQKMAIKWVKDNIGSFGGDPNMITIFGESAGGGSVTAQMMGQHNIGLFQRVISESASLFDLWYESEKVNSERIENLKTNINCELDDIYECYKGKTGLEVLQSSPIGLDFFYHPVPDDDFFSSNITEEKFYLARKFDLLAGFNGMEGGIYIAAFLEPYLQALNKVVTNGCSLADMRSLLTGIICPRFFTSQAPELCAEFIIDTYNMVGSTNDTERVIQFIKFGGDWGLVVDIIDLLDDHSKGMKSTYGYLFSKYIPGIDVSPSLDPYKFSANHGDDIPYVFGYPYITDELLSFYGDYFNNSVIQFTNNSRYTATPNDKELSDDVMTAWTNFAKSGNPMTPMTVPSLSNWTQYTLDKCHLLEFGSALAMTEIPDWTEKQRMRDRLFPARYRKMEDEKLVVCPTPSSNKKVVDGNTGPVSLINTWMMISLLSAVLALV